jgi:hypothetical protein
MRRRRLLDRLLRGSVNNVSFADACDLAEGLGLRLARIKGSQHVFVHPDLSERRNLQNVNGEAKPYQLRHLSPWFVTTL